MVYHRADEIVDWVGIDHPDLTGNSDKHNCFDSKKTNPVL